MSHLYSLKYLPNHNTKTYLKSQNYSISALKYSLKYLANHKKVLLLPLGVDSYLSTRNVVKIIPTTRNHGI
ncbi:hypothetical protein Hanom_Chr02g00106881 [Helianthus anomalus]